MIGRAMLQIFRLLLFMRRRAGSPCSVPSRPGTRKLEQKSAAIREISVDTV